MQVTSGYVTLTLSTLPAESFTQKQELSFSNSSPGCVVAWEDPCGLSSVVSWECPCGMNPES